MKGLLPKAVNSTFYINAFFCTLCHMDLTGFEKNAFFRPHSKCDLTGFGKPVKCM